MLIGLIASVTLRWGGDSSGGGPYIYEGENGKLVGFEVDLASYLGAKLGRESEFVYGDWGRLPYLLDRRTIDIVLNGYEWSREREEKWSSTVPYYVYALQLLVRADDERIHSADDLTRRPGSAKLRVGVLSGSAAERWLQDRDDVEVLPFLDVVRTMQLVRDGQLDATLQDAPAATHYAHDFPELREAGPAFAPGYYVIFVRKDDAALKDDLDRAIREGLADGSIAHIYQRYGLWNAEQDRLISLAEHWPPEIEPPKEGAPSLARWTKTLIRAAVTTALLAGLAMPLAMILGLATAGLQIYGPRRLARPLRIYVELVRGTPVLFQLYVIYYVLPAVGLKIPEFWAGVIGLGINYSAYEAENYRAGFLAIPKGQIEAAWSLGMDTLTALRRVIVPQAARLVLPPVTGDFIALFKDTSVCSVIAVTELSNTYNRLSNDHPLQAAELGLITAALYLLMSLPLSFLTRRLEKEGS